MKNKDHHPGDIWKVVKGNKELYFVQFFNKTACYDTYDKAKDMADAAIEVLYRNSILDW